MKIKHYIDLIIEKKNQLLASFGAKVPSDKSSAQPSAASSGFNLKEFISKVPRVPYSYNQASHAHIDPLQPFILPHMFAVDYKGLKMSNRSMTPAQHEAIFREKINLKNFMSETQAPILKKMYDDLKFVYDALTVLKTLGIDFTIDLTGGAVRDFVLGKADKIKDLDVMISMSSGYSSYKIRSLTTEDFEKAGFTQAHLDAVEWGGETDWAVDENVVTCKLIALCFERHNAVSHKYFHSRDSRAETRDLDKPEDPASDYADEMARDRLQGVIKLAHPSFNYEIDLLVTDLAKPQFLNEFDIDICKASFSISNSHYKTTFPKDHSHLVSRFIANQYFWADVLNKTLTVNTTTKSKKMVASTIEKHLPRVEAKYSDYKAQFAHSSNPNDAVLEFANLTYNLKKEIPEARPSTGQKHKI